MSGAAVWSAGRIIGLVAEHHRADGLGRLAATRVDHWHERLAPEQLDQLRLLLPGLPDARGGLGEVVPAAPAEVLGAGYTAQVGDIAPEVLQGREEELAELVEFCAGEDRYGWWQAGPWAGKSALAAWFVLHPPAGTVAASFFVTGRLAGQADSEAFTEAMIEQLAAIAGEPAAGAATPAGRDRERRRLLDLAGARVAERQQRLVLVVDGLDEDEGATAGSGKPSIAALLPKRPPAAVRVLITSRPNPGVPGDVPADHPLRRCQPRRLAPSPFAHEVEVEAKRELVEQLHGDPLQVDRDRLHHRCRRRAHATGACRTHRTGRMEAGRQARQRVWPQPEDSEPRLTRPQWTAVTVSTCSPTKRSGASLSRNWHMILAPIVSASTGGPRSIAPKAGQTAPPSTCCAPMAACLAPAELLTG